MRLPAISGIIERRILANFRIDPECMAAALPSPFRPQCVGGWAIGGICLIRLARIRPTVMPFPFGLRSENAAHRIAVEWEVAGETRQGVYIPRRDTNSRLNVLAGGRLFPGVHHHARFAVIEDGDHVSVKMTSDDGSANVHVSGTRVETLSKSSVFESVQDASRFFEQGSLGYSDSGIPDRFDGLELQCKNWVAEPMEINVIRSSYFEDTNRFPVGSVDFDCALLMRDIDHQWHGREDLCCSVAKDN